MRADVACVLGFVAGLGAAHVMQRPVLDAYSVELAHAHRLAARRGDLLARTLAEAEAAAALLDRAEAALAKCRAPIARGAIAPFEITGYGIGCDAPGPHTKSGTTPVEGHSIAADPRVLPAGSRVRIAGLGVRQVEDVGADVKGRVLDVFFADCADAWAMERQVRTVEVLYVAAK